MLTKRSREVEPRFDVELYLQPGAAVAAAHWHPSLTERFEVLEGEVGFLVGGDERAVRPGAGVTEVAAGTVHDWWNSGPGIARVRVTVEVAPGGSPDAAERFVELIEVLWSLGAEGRVNEAGLPDPLWMAAIGHEYRDVIRFVKPPAAVQAVMFPVLGGIGRMLGRRPTDPRLHGPEAAMYIDDPGDDLDALLTGSVGAGEARGHGSGSS